MKIKNFLSIAAIAMVMVSCGGNKTEDNQDTNMAEDTVATAPAMTTDTAKDSAPQETTAPQAATGEETVNPQSATTNKATTTTTTTTTNKSDVVKKEGSAAVKEVVDGNAKGKENATGTMTNKLENYKAGEAANSKEGQNKTEGIKNGLKNKN